MVKKEQLSVIDFFCGAGGFSEGFRQLGFNIVQGYDYWRPAIDTYNHNFNLDSKVQDILSFNNSIQEINKVPDTDVILGSPPCVTFSYSNNSGKADKESGLLLIKTFLKIVVVKKYQKNSILKAWFMENVPNSRKYLPDYYTFEDLGLSEWAQQNNYLPSKIVINLKDSQALINAADYGSYQARKRVVSGEIIHLGALVVPMPTHSEKNTKYNTSLKPWKRLGDLLSKIPLPTSPYTTELIKDPIYSEIEIPANHLTDQFYDSGLYQVEWEQTRYLKTNHPYMGKMSFPENINKPSRTITATKSVTSREALIYKSEYHRDGDGEYRSPTVREAASIMGFPYTFQFIGSVHTKWRLVGNAVCPSVSRAFATQLLKELSITFSVKLKLSKASNLEGINSLNSYKAKVFDTPPTRQKNSRFRRHPIKDGNLTVTLSNYDINKNTPANNFWETSIQYGTGDGFPIQPIKNGYYIEIEPAIQTIKNGSEFIRKINNGFSEKIGSSKELQSMYEQQISLDNLLEPITLIDEIKKLIEEADIQNISFAQKDWKFFTHKDVIPATQLFALYAVNKISTVANSK